MAAALSFALCLAGLGLLALAMHRHHRTVSVQPLPRWQVVAMRVAGAMALAAALPVATGDLGWSIGAVLHCALLSPAGIVVALLLARRKPRG